MIGISTTEPLLNQHDNQTYMHTTVALAFHISLLFSFLTLFDLHFFLSPVSFLPTHFTFHPIISPYIPSILSLSLLPPSLRLSPLLHIFPHHSIYSVHIYPSPLPPVAPVLPSVLYRTSHNIFLSIIDDINQHKKTILNPRYVHLSVGCQHTQC